MPPVHAIEVADGERCASRRRGQFVISLQNDHRDWALTPTPVCVTLREDARAVAMRLTDWPAQAPAQSLFAGEGRNNAGTLVGRLV
jgi:hypothetical protein